MHPCEVQPIYMCVSYATHCGAQAHKLRLAEFARAVRGKGSIQNGRVGSGWVKSFSNLAGPMRSGGSTTAISFFVFSSMHGAYHLPPWKGLYFHRRCSASIYIFSLSVEVGGNFHHLPQPNPVGAAIYFHQLPQASLLPWKLFYFQRKTVYCHRRTFLFNASRFVTSMKVKFTSADYFCFHGVNLLAWSYSRTRLCEGSTTRSRYRAEAGQ